MYTSASLLPLFFVPSGEFLAMICLRNLLPRSHALVPQGIRGRGQRIRFPVVRLETVRAEPCRIAFAMNEHSGSTSSTEKDTTSFIDKEEDLKSEIYSHNMTEAMGEELMYRHELGMNYNSICPDLIVGSCLQTLEDVDKLRKIGVKTIFCLQQNSDLEYFGVDINSIQKYAESCDDIKHYRAEIRDFDAFDLRMKLPSVVGTLHKAISCNGGITYIHCTAGLGRAPAVTLAYMFWLRGYKLQEAHELLLSKRPCCPKLEAIKSATADILTGFSKKNVNLMWEGSSCSTVEVSGLDIGWGQRNPLKYDEGKQAWTLERELPEGKYEYKYVIDGEWKYNVNEPVTKPNSDGHVNNYLHVHDTDSSMETMLQREHVMGDGIDLSMEQVGIIKDFLESSSKDFMW